MRAADIFVLRAGFWALSPIESRSPSAMVVTLKAAYWSLFEADTFRCCLFLLVWTSTSSTSPSASAPRRSAVRRVGAAQVGAASECRYLWQRSAGRQGLLN